MVFQNRYRHGRVNKLAMVLFLDDHLLPQDDAAIVASLSRITNCAKVYDYRLFLHKIPLNNCITTSLPFVRF
jgi:hypothetical protein